MKSIGLYYFSGTGNTKKVNELLAGELEKNNCAVTLLSVEETLKSQRLIDCNQYDLIGLSYPIYGFGTPGIISRFVNQLADVEGRNLFLLKTGADFISINHNASTKLIGYLEKKNFNVFYDRIIVMPSNWIVTYDDRIIKQLYNCAKVKVNHMCREILELKRRRYKTGLFLRKLSLGISYLEKNYGSVYFGKSLRVNKNCNHCNLCVKNCPNQNISLIDDSPVFGDQCLFCMRCIYSCSTKAIESNFLSFCILKNGYNLHKVLDDVAIKSDYIGNETKGYFKHFNKYLLDESL